MSSLNHMAVVICTVTQAPQWANSSKVGYRCTKCGQYHPKASSFQVPKL